jgi:hypothetical protein
MPDEPEHRMEKTPKGLSVPVPKRSEFFSNLKKIARPKSTSSTPPSSAAEK